MLFSLGHGQHVVQQEIPAARPDDRPHAPTVPLAAVAPEMRAAAPQRLMAMADGQDAAPEGDAMVSYAPPAVEPGKFRYLFPYAEGLPERPDMPALLDALADSMVEEGGDPAGKNSSIPPVFTYLGQFIDHDLTANTDREVGTSTIDGAITPLPREEVERDLANLRDGSLALDSLYGDAAGQHPFAMKLSGLMRFPGNQAKMRLATPAPIGARPPLPATDNATDLLRLGFLLRNGLVTEDELKALTPPDLRRVFIGDSDAPILSRAIIGDARNDENLLVAQLHVLFLRLHNKLADATGGRSFERARRMTRWHYQWLVVNSYLPTICDPGVVAEVIDMEAPLYAAFFAEHGGLGPKMPMPLEFSIAAFRFGHSMVRAVYDHNRIFGTPDGAGENFGPTPFNLLFAFTGNGGMPPALPTDPPNATGQLPQRWVIEWERFVRAAPGLRAARKIDTDLAPPLADMVNEAAGVFKHLARRNLRRGYRLNLPTAQACVAASQGAGFKPFPALTPEQLRSGGQARQGAMAAGGFDEATPLWFYVLKEAEVLGGGEHLGPPGSHLVANTLLGLIVNDPDSYWNADGGHWSPARFRPNDPIDSIEDVARFCGMM